MVVWMPLNLAGWTPKLLPPLAPGFPHLDQEPIYIGLQILQAWFVGRAHHLPGGQGGGRASQPMFTDTQ